MMLASEPLSSRAHAGGGISVCVNGAIVAAHDGTRSSVVGGPNNSSEFRTGNTGSSEKKQHLVAEDADVECRDGWANATITWRSGAQQYSGGRTFDVQSNNKKKSLESVPSSDAVDPDSSSSARLVHVIRVLSSASPSPATNNKLDTTNAVAMETSSETTARITITNGNSAHPAPTKLSVNGEHCRDKIAVVVGPSPNHMMKAEDERSSSGASSAPGSDCERSDSDREGDDGTDSGFSPSRRQCATSIMVNAKNASNASSTYSSLTSTSSGDSTTTSGIITKVPVGSSGGGSVRLTIASYADKTEENGNGMYPLDGSDQWDMHFHLRELDAVPSNNNKKQDSEDVQTKIAAAHALISGHSGMFTLKNRVKSSIVSLLVQSATNRNYDQEERGRIVFYTTSMGIVRNTFERCRRVRKILETLMVKFEERDVFMNRSFQLEVRERLAATRVIVPQVFVEGRHLGSAEILEQLNEIGHLRELLRPYKRQSVGGTCQQCGGYRYLLCPICGGSKKSVTHRHHFSDDLVALRCVTCDESGLIRCPQCINGEG